jgi:hypothetical protein
MATSVPQHLPTCPLYIAKRTSDASSSVVFYYYTWLLSTRCTSLVGLLEPDQRTPHGTGRIGEHELRGTAQALALKRVTLATRGPFRLHLGGGGRFLLCHFVSPLCCVAVCVYYAGCVFLSTYFFALVHRTSRITGKNARIVQKNCSLSVTWPTSPTRLVGPAKSPRGQ